jgi:hypothetical protein
MGRSICSNAIIADQPLLSTRRRLIGEEERLPQPSPPEAVGETP